MDKGISREGEKFTNTRWLIFYFFFLKLDQIVALKVHVGALEFDHVGWLALEKVTEQSSA